MTLKIDPMSGAQTKVFTTQNMSLMVPEIDEDDEHKKLPL
jgi:hypothetical protein